MQHGRASLREQQVNDYLDLFNYAVSLGDIEWQQSILAELAKPESLEDTTPYTFQQRSELQKDFDKVNGALLELYHQLHEAEDHASRTRLWNHIWVLKRVRVEIGKQMRALEEVMKQ